jgi:hypothetical protein
LEVFKIRHDLRDLPKTQRVAESPADALADVVCKKCIEGLCEALVNSSINEATDWSARY